MHQSDPASLLARFLEAVADVPIDVEHKAEVVINLAKAWGIDDSLLRPSLGRALGPEASDHPYFHWQPRARFPVGAWVRVVDGAPQVLGKKGRISLIENPKRDGVRGMAKGFFYTVVLEGTVDGWGFREEQLEEARP